MRLHSWRLMAAVLVLLPVLAATAAAADSRQSHRDEEGLSGAVKAVLEESAAVAPDGAEGPRRPVRRVQFDPDGMISRVTWYNASGIYSDKGNVYDSARRLAASGRYLADGSFVREQEFAYDSAGRLAEQRALRPDQSLFLRRIFEYDAAGRMTGERRYDADGHLISATEHDYDPGGNRLETRHLDAGGAVTLREVYGYDADGAQVIRRTCQYGIADYGAKSFRIDASGRRTEETDFSADGVVAHRYQCEYVPSGAKAFQQHFRADGSLASLTLFGSGGLPGAYYTFRPDGTVECGRIYTYLFDSAGNWTVRNASACRNVFVGQVSAQEVTYRTLSYY